MHVCFASWMLVARTLVGEQSIVTGEQEPRASTELCKVHWRKMAHISQQQSVLPEKSVDGVTSAQIKHRVMEHARGHQHGCGGLFLGETLMTSDAGYGVARRPSRHLGVPRDSEGGETLPGAR